MDFSEKLLYGKKAQIMKVALLCPPLLDDFQSSVIQNILFSGHNVYFCLIDKRKGKSALARLGRNIKRGRGGYITVMALKKVFLKRPSASTKELMLSKSIQFLETEDIYGEETLSKLRQIKPDVMCLIGGFGIIKNELLSIAQFGILSYHHGDLSKYRGQPPAFWELYNGEKEIGVTVQKLSSGLDSGIPIIEKKIAVNDAERYRVVRDRIFKESTKMMADSLNIVEKTPFAPLKEYGKLYTLPNLRQWIWFNLKMFNRWIKYVSKNLF